MTNRSPEALRSVPIEENDELHLATARAARAEAYADHMARILAITDYLSVVNARTDVARIILEQAGLALQAQGGYVLGFDRTYQQLDVIEALGEEKRIAHEAFAPATVAMLATFARRGQPTYFASASELLARHPEASPHLAMPGVIAFLPLEFTGRALGTLVLRFPEEARFDDTDTMLLAALSQQCAIALHRIEATEALDQARTRLAQGEKMSALGQLVSGVAHEIRTPLTYLTNNLYLIGAAARRMAVELPPERARAHTRDLEACLADAGESIERIDHIVEDLRRFTRLRVQDRSMRELHVVAADAVRLFRATEKRRRPVEADLGETPPIPMDQLHVEQVILNLLHNAADAAREGSRATRLSTRVEPDGAWATLVVSDDGVGMSPEVLARAFEPLYTTKSEGSGFGLSIVKRIVDEHNGHIHVDTAPGRGTTVTIRLPTR